MPYIALILALLIAAPAAAADKLYRWVDEDGNVHYGDRIPPKYAKQEREVLNERGIVIERSERQKTDTELANERREAEAAARAERAREEQLRHDQFLITTYATQDQLVARRDEQLSILDGQIRSGQKSIADSEATLEKLQQRAESLRKQDKPVPEKLADQIENFEAALTAGKRALAAMQAERKRVADEFERDLARYIELSN